MKRDKRDKKLVDLNQWYIFPFPLPLSPSFSPFSFTFLLLTLTPYLFLLPSFPSPLPLSPSFSPFPLPSFSFPLSPPLPLSPSFSPFPPSSFSFPLPSPFSFNSFLISFILLPPPLSLFSFYILFVLLPLFYLFSPSSSNSSISSISLSYQAAPLLGRRTSTPSMIIYHSTFLFDNYTFQRRETNVFLSNKNVIIII